MQDKASVFGTTANVTYTPSVQSEKREKSPRKATIIAETIDKR